jgi:hypothetical protein
LYIRTPQNWSVLPYITELNPALSSDADCGFRREAAIAG